MNEKFDTPDESEDVPTPTQSTEPHSPEMIASVQGKISANDTGTDKTDDTNLNPPGGLKDLNTRGGHPLPKVVDTPHVIEHYKGSINLEDGPQESGVTRIPPEAIKQPPKEDKEGKPGSLTWRGGGGVEKGG